jgi:two-component sensor histidine kinase
MSFKAILATCQQDTGLSLVHQKLYESGNLSAIKIGEYVHDLTGLLCRGIGTGAGSVNFELETGDTELSINEAIPLGLILNELVSNSVKHGRRDDLNISIFTRVTGEGLFILEYGDNGAGLPADFSVETHSRMGFQTLMALGETQLNGRFRLLPGAGFHCALEFEPSVAAGLSDMTRG